MRLYESIYLLTYLFTYLHKMWFQLSLRHIRVLAPVHRWDLDKSAICACSIVLELQVGRDPLLGMVKVKVSQAHS